MNGELNQHVDQLRHLTTAQLQLKYRELFRQASHSNHKGYLFRRVAWRLQAVAEGGLSERARAYAREIAADADLRLCAPQRPMGGPPAVRAAKASRQLDPRVPPAGTQLIKRYKDETLTVTVLEDGYQYRDRVYKSLSAIARQVTGNAVERAHGLVARVRHTETQFPNSYDQLPQDQRQRVLTWSVAPGYQHTFSSHTLLTVNPYIRKDQFNYYPSRDLFNDTPATQSQNRQLLNWGVKADISTTSGRHNLKYGVDLKQTRLLENFAFGVTDPTFNSPCIDANGASIGDPTLTNPSQCAAAGFQSNTADNPNASAPFSPSLLLYDLTRNGHQFTFHGTHNINQYAFYVQDDITVGNFLFKVGFRLDRYDGITSRTGPEPRLGIAYNLKKTGTVLRVAYARTFETPYNENLLLASATGAGGLAQNVFGSNSVPIDPGFRNQFNTGFQQAVGKLLVIDADYFWKYTHNAYDFGTLLNTTLAFPIAWHNSKLDGVTGRVSTTNIHGFQAYYTFGHNRARYFFPEQGGLIPQGTPLNGSVFRIDHDQAFQSTLSLRYQRPKNAEWVILTYRFDSGLVVSGVPDAGAALGLTPNQGFTRSGVQWRFRDGR